LIKGFNMKILIDPKMAILIQGFSDAECAELLRCIFEYPNRDCNLGLWKYIKDQIDADAKKYRDKCERMAELRRRKAFLKLEQELALKSELNSEVIEEVEENKLNKNKIKCSERSKPIFAVENSVESYQITETFTFSQIEQTKPAFTKYLALYGPAVAIKAEQTLKKKRQGQWLSLQQILEWIDQENRFYQQNHGA